MDGNSVSNGSVRSSNIHANANNPYHLNQMSISQMRALSTQALREAEAKQTELRLVLSSRYRELVGSSDEVLAMKEMAEKLHSAMEALPTSARALMMISGSAPTAVPQQKEIESTYDAPVTLPMIKEQLSVLPRILHRALDKQNPHTAAVALVQLFSYMKSRIHLQKSSSSSQSSIHMYPLVLLLGKDLYDSQNKDLPHHNNDNNDYVIDPYELLLLDTQIRMVYLHVQTLPLRIMKLAKQVLLRKSMHSEESSRGALAALALLAVETKLKSNQNQSQLEIELKSSLNESNEITSQNVTASRLLDIYYDSKAKLIHQLLNGLSHISSIVNQPNVVGNQASTASNIVIKCEKIISDIVSVIQFDIILHSYRLFCQSQPFSSTSKEISAWPEFDSHLVKLKCSHFLTSHIPPLRSQIRDVLVASVSVDASMLGDIRRSLYETTTNPKNITSKEWEQAIDSVVDWRLVTSATFGSSASTLSSAESEPNLNEAKEESLEVSKSSTSTPAKFSLWSALFSSTFSSLVHDLLSSSFHSVHTSTISTLLQSLSYAPRRVHVAKNPPDSTFTFPAMLSSSNLLLRPHEAHRNTLVIASQLDRSLQKLSDDAHHLLVHAEEREESERRLRQSLYVQTCEIMGRLLSEIRRMVAKATTNEDYEEEDIDESDDATKEMIVGRLCHLLQSRQLVSLKKLLDPNNAPAPASTSIGTSTRKFEFGVQNNNILNRSFNSNGYGSRGMITLNELRSAFEIADDDGDGLISFTEAVEAMGGAFSGTPFNGAEMVRSTLLITSASGSHANASKSVPAEDNDSNTLQNVTLHELGLLSAKGLRHDTDGKASAMGLIESSLEYIVQLCFSNWARIVLSPLTMSLKISLHNHLEKGREVINEEWHRVHQLETYDISSKKLPLTSSVSDHTISYLLSISSEMNGAICPADSIPSDFLTQVPSLVEIVRNTLLEKSIQSLSDVFENIVHEEKKDVCSSCIAQLLYDIRFMHYCYFENKSVGYGTPEMIEKFNVAEKELLSHLDQEFGEDTKEYVSNNFSIDLSRLFLSNLFGNDHHAFHSNSVLPSHETALSTNASNSIHSTLLNPLDSSRRFVLLPIQSEKQINELELRSAFAGKIDEADMKDDAKDAATGVGSGFGFFSSMLKKK